MWKYKNGNYTVKILDDGTKYRLSNNPKPKFPESIDVKINNKCNANCAFCHENSTPDGKEFDPDFAYKLFKDLPAGVELAIGGGNPLESMQDLKWMMRKLGRWAQNLIINITINALHMEDTAYLYPRAFGISYRRELHKEIKDFCKKSDTDIQKVIHLIAGVHTIDDLERCYEDFDRILILGYKKFGKGKSYHSKDVEKNIKKWGEDIGQYVHDKIVVFDNLAVTQLDMERFYLKDQWDEIYMGDDGQFTMYLDLVEKKYAVSSSSEERFDIGDLTIKEMFKEVRSKSA